MKAHIIPQSYLKGFVDPNSPEGQTPYLHLYDFSESTWSRKAPKRALWQTDFYALPGVGGEEKDALDHGPMSQIEQRAERLTREKFVPRLPLTTDEKREYAEFIALMMGRVPAHRELTDRIINDMATTPMKLLATHHPERYVRMAEAYERETGRKAPTIEEYLQIEEGEIRLRANQYEYLNGMAGVMDVAPDALEQMQWTFFHIAAPNWLVTSDNPVSLRVPDHPELGFGLHRKDIQIMFPITRTMGLLAIWSNDNDHHIDLPEDGDLGDGNVVAVAKEWASHMNMLQIGHATQQIAAPSQHFPGEEWLDQKAELPQLLHLVASEMNEDSE